MGDVLQSHRAVGAGTVQRPAALWGQHQCQQRDVQYAVSGAGWDGNPQSLYWNSESAAWAARGLFPVPAHSALRTVSAQPSIAIFRAVQLQYSAPIDSQ